MLEPGALVAGKLRIERILGEGGMGTVAAATHVGLDQRVAIKVLKPELANQPEVVARFVREARAAAKLKSEHVCRVTDVGETADRTAYIEMELLDGRDLASLIAIRPLAIDVAADYVVQACVAIAEAHHLGIVHRDLKPANLFATQRIDGTALIKVLDFGIATAPSAEDLQITKTTTVMGSPGYMSPEHLRSARDVDVRSDIWALGVILYEAVTGKLPFSATSITELAVKVVMDEPAPLTNVDPRFAAVVARCLKKPPGERYQNVAELAADLGELGGPTTQATAQLVAKLLGGASPSRAHSAAASVPAINPAALAPTAATMASPAKASTTLGGAAGSSLADGAPPKKKKTALVALAAVALVGGAAAAFVLVKRDTEKPVPPVAHAAHRRDGHDPNIRTALRDLAAKNDYAGILALQDLDKTDPEIAKIVADAKHGYTAQRVTRIQDHVKRDDCAGAKQIASDAAGVLPESKPDFDNAATCTAGSATPVGSAAAPTGSAAPPTQVASTPSTPNKPKPPTPPPPPVAHHVDPETEVRAAQSALDRHDYAAARAAARRVLEAEPENRPALHVLGVAACRLHDDATYEDAMRRARGMFKVESGIRRACNDRMGE